MHIIIRLYILLSLSLLLLSACSLDIPLEDRIADPDAIIDAASARKALATAYANYNGWQTMIELSALSDDVMPSPTLSKNIELHSYYHWKEHQLIQLSQHIWESNYKTIMYVNAVMERISLLHPQTGTEREKLSAVIKEGKALKASCYFQLMRLFSPRYTSDDNAEKSLGIVHKKNVKLEKPSRMTLAETADSIRALIIPYVNESNVVKSSNRWLSSTAARCLMAELEMWTGNYDKVTVLCEPIIASFDDTLFGESTYGTLWTQSNINNKESVFNIDLSSSSDIHFFDNWSGSDGDYLVINKHIGYEKSDIRRQPSVQEYKFPVNFGASYRDVLLLNKYNGTRKQNKNIRFISGYRLSDFVFLAAEAYAQTGEKEKSTRLINNYLQKRGARQVEKSLSKEKLIEQILKEKQKEFLCEGRRFFDLKRLANKPLKRTFLFDDNALYIQTDDFRWTLPIPASEYRYNPNIEQNKGWEDFMPKPQL